MTTQCALVLLGLACFAPTMSAQYQTGRYEPPSNFGPTVAYEPISAHAYAFIGTGTNDIWRYDAGTWVRVTTPSPRPAAAYAVATWPGHGALVLSNAETWLFDGTDWHQLAGVNSAPYATMMAYDSARQRMVAVGGSTYEFDGNTWQAVLPSSVLSARRLAWCGVRQRVLLLAASGADSRAYYTWNGTAWVFEESDFGPTDGAAMAPCASGEVAVQGGYTFPITHALPRLWPSHAISGVQMHQELCSWYDAGRQVTVVTTAGGFFTGNYSAWEFGNGWNYSAAGRQPYGPSTMAYDSWRGLTCMYGGVDNIAQEQGELWTFRSVRWAYRTGLASVQRAAMTFDSRRGCLVIFGGGAFDRGGGGWFPGTSMVTEWDGQAERHFLPAFSPSPRLDPGFAFDRLRGRAVLFGGSALPSGTLLDDTYEWDGMSWTRGNPTIVPPPNASGMTFDGALGRCVLVSAATLYAWDGSDWGVAGTAPNGRPCFDEARDRLLVFGASGIFERNGSAWTQVDQTRVYGQGAFDAGTGQIVGFDGGGTFTIGVPGAAQIQPFGTACAGTAGTPVLHGEQPPRLQRMLDLRVENLPVAGVFVGVLGGEENDWLGAPLPFALDAFGLPGCTLYTAVDIHELRSGADWPIPVPGDPALLGATCRAQALVVDPTANGFGATTTNGLRLRVGN